MRSHSKHRLTIVSCPIQGQVLPAAIKDGSAGFMHASLMMDLLSERKILGGVHTLGDRRDDLV